MGHIGKHRSRASNLTIDGISVGDVEPVRFLRADAGFVASVPIEVALEEGMRSCMHPAAWRRCFYECGYVRV